MVKAVIALVKVAKWSFLYSIWQFYIRMGPLFINWSEYIHSNFSAKYQFSSAAPRTVLGFNNRSSTFRISVFCKISPRSDL